MSKSTAADDALAKLRVARATLIGVRECLTDALVFVNRGVDRLEDCHARVEEAFGAAGIPVGPLPKRAPMRKKKAPATKTGA